MVNPAEDIVNIWLQEIRDYFTMSNIVVRKGTRVINGKKVGGGRGKEIDLISTDGKGKYFWIEVSVSPSPRLPSKKEKFREIVSNTVKKFADEKKQYLIKRFGRKNFHKIFVYSPKLFSQKSHMSSQKSDEENRYRAALKEKKIEAVSFTDVLNEIYKKLNYMGYDATRNYLFLIKKFLS
jgi:hypothetical protein